MKQCTTRPLAIVSAALIAAGGLAGCGSSGAGDASSQSLVYTFGTDGSQNYDPQQSANIYAYGYEVPIFDTLLAYGDDGALVPRLATSYTVNDSGDRITLKLRDGVRFHDGTALDSAAVKASFERGRTLPTSTIKDFLAPIKDISTPDGTTVVLTIKSGTAAALLGAFTDRAGMIVSPAAVKRSDFSLHPVGTGPFEVSEKSVPGKDMIYTKFSKYWDPSVQKLDTLDIRVVATPALKAAVIGKTIDLAVTTLPQTVTKEIQNSGVDVTYPLVQHLETLYLNKNGPFADPKLRQAVSAAIDRTTIAAAIGNKCEPDSQAVASNSVYYDKTLAPVTRDLERAKRLLAEAGKPNGFGFTAAVVADHPDSLNVLQVVQEQLKEVGIKLTLKPLPPAQLLPAFTSGKVDSYKGTFPGSQDPNSLATTLTSVYSPGGHSDALLTRLADQGAGQVKADERIATFHKWQQRYQSTAWHVGLCNSAVPVLKVRAENVHFIDPMTLDPRGLSLK